MDMFYFMLKEEDAKKVREKNLVEFSKKSAKKEEIE